MKPIYDTSSRFRILKGGKISLVVSALLVGSSVVGSGLYAQDVITAAQTTPQTYDYSGGGDTDVDLNVTTGSIAVTGAGAQTAVDIIRPSASSYNTTITNQGTVSAYSTDSSTSMAISIMGYSAGYTTGSISITNSGTISATTAGDSKGIYIAHHDALMNIRNDTTGVISAQADNGTAKGIDVYASNIDGFTLTNSGTISATAGSGGNEAYGVQFRSNNDLNVNNTTIENQLGAEISATSVNSNAIGIDFYSGNYLVLDTTSITNAGTISAISTNYNAYGIRLKGYYSTKLYDTSITNSGTITATAGDNSKAYGIYAGNLYFNSTKSFIKNTGTISAIAGYQGSATAIFIRDMRGTSYISNAANQTISALAGDQGNAIAINIGNMNDTSHIENEGTISATAGNNATAYALNIGNMGDSSYITNSGTITATINGLADEAAYSIRAQGTVNINNTSIGNLNGNLSVIGTLTNDGTIRLPYNATNAFVTSFVNNGTLQIGLLTNGTLGGTTHSTLGADDATFNNGSTINVNVLAASTHADLLVDQTIQDVVTANNSLTINGTLHVTDNSALLNFEYVQDGNTIDLNVVQGTTILDSAIAGGGNSNAQSVASALQAIQDAGSYPEMDSFFSALNGLSSDAEIASAVESTTPAATNASSSATTQIMNGVQGMVEMRQNTMMGTGGMNSGDINLVDKNLWVKLFGSRGSQDKKDGINGFDVKAHGLGIGADAEVSPRQRVGAALFYTDASVDVNNMPQTSDLKVYTALVYGNVPVNTNTDFLYQVGYSWQKTETDRTILPTYDHARADYTSRTASLNLKLMQSYNLRNDLVVHPLVETTYRHYTNPSYSESGAGALNLQVDNFTSTQLVTGGGAIFDYKLDKDSKLSTDLRIGYDWHHNAQTVTSSYQGASGVDFTTSGIDNGGWQYDIGLGYETAKLLDGELEFMYNYQAQGSSFKNNVLSAKYTYKF